MEGITYRGFFVNGLDDKFFVIERDVPDFTPREAYLGSQSIEMEMKNIRNQKDREGWCLSLPTTNFSFKEVYSVPAQPALSCATRLVVSIDSAQRTFYTTANILFLVPISEVHFIIFFVEHGPCNNLSQSSQLYLTGILLPKVLKVGKKVNNELQDSEVTWNNNLSVSILTKNRPGGR